MEVQIYPHVYEDVGYHEGYTAGYEAGYAEGDSKAFTRGVLTVFWFFYRLMKPKGPSGEA